MAPKFYALDLSPPCRAVLMACEAQNIPIEYISVNVLENEHLKEDFVKKNPMHTVPTLEDGDLIIHDSHVIITYLTEKYGKPAQWYPKDVKQRAMVDQKLYFEALLFTKIRSVTAPAFSAGVRVPSEKTVNDVTGTYGFLEQFLSQSKYVAGDHLTIADISVLATLSSLNRIIPVDAKKFPKTNAWLKELEKQQFYQKQNVPGNEKFIKLVKTVLDI